MRWLLLGIPVAVAIILYALFHALFTPASRVRSLPKAVWIVAIIILPLVGAGLWFWLGAPRKKAAQSPSRPPQRGLGPDDDPEFLRRLETQRRQKERDARLSQREAELDRREREIKERRERMPGGGTQNGQQGADPHAGGASGDDESPHRDNGTESHPDPHRPDAG